MYWTLNYCTSCTPAGMGANKVAGECTLYMKLTWSLSNKEASHVHIFIVIAMPAMLPAIRLSGAIFPERQLGFALQAERDEISEIMLAFRIEHALHVFIPVLISDAHSTFSPL